MPKRYTKRKLEVFAIHAHIDKSQVDYQVLFKTIADIAAEDRQIDGDERLYAVPTFEIKDGIASFVCYEGERGLNPLIFNTSNAKERVEKLKRGEILATKTHGIIDIKNRIAIVEYNHRGAKAHDLAKVFEDCGRNSSKFPSLTIEFNPVVDEEFVKAIERFQRIRLASLRVAKPNINWSDHYHNLTEVAEDSDAQAMEVTFTASRGKTLSAKAGIVHFIKDLVRDKLSIIKSAKVLGTRENETAETAVSLAHHVEHQKVRVKLNDDGHVESDDIEKRMQGYLHSRHERKAK